VLTVLALALPASQALARGIGIAGYGGITVPVLSDDADRGTQFGVRAPVRLIPMLTFEPFYESNALGDVTEDFGGVSYTRSGGDVSRYGLNALVEFGTGVSFYPYGGISQHNWTRDGSADVNEVGYNVGIGLGFAIPAGFRIDVRGELDVIPTDDTSRKLANANVGVSYNVFKMP